MRQTLQRAEKRPRLGHAQFAHLGDIQPAHRDGQHFRPQALSMAGYQVLYGENGEVIIRNSMLEEDMAVQISELLDQGKGSTNE